MTLGDLGDYADRLEAHVGKRADVVINYKCPTLRAIIATLRLAEKEIARCHERLEIDHHYMNCGDGKGPTRVNVPIDERGKYPDGVSCRDETIKILQRAIISPRGGGRD